MFSTMPPRSAIRYASLVVFFSLSPCLGSYPPAAAAGPVTDELQTAARDLFQAVHDPTFPTVERQRRVHQALANIVDVGAMAQRIVGPRWQTITQPERDEFVRALTALLYHRYVSKYIDRLRPSLGRPRLRFAAEVAEHGSTTVQSVVTLESRQEVSIAFRLHRPVDRWLVYDVQALGRSLVNALHTEFAPRLQRGSFVDFVRSLEREVETTPLPREACERDGRGIFAAILESFYTLAQQLGRWIVLAIQQIVPSMKVPGDLAEPLGVLALLTIAVITAQVAGKVVWAVVALGWVLILIRVGMALWQARGSA